ncbi:MAG: cupin domain-containing protein [Smithellaceae bacterium]|nr:cupin domain-containing protein [Smithellaceae bacterium]
MEVIDLKEREIFDEESMGVASIADESYLQINMVCLAGGQEVPLHTTNSTVTISVLYGTGSFYVGEQRVPMSPGKLLRIPYRTLMSITNDAAERMAFLVIKTPHPREMVVF